MALCWHSQHQRVSRHVTIHYGSRTNKSVLANSDATNNGAICAECRTTPNMSLAIFVFTSDGRARVVDIGKDHARPTKNIVFQPDGVIHRHIVLYLDVVADYNIVTNEDVLP